MLTLPLKRASLFMSTHPADRLNVVTFEQHPTEPFAGSTSFHDCTGYTCAHHECVQERAERVAQGVRPRLSLPVKYAA